MKTKKVTLKKIINEILKTNKEEIEVLFIKRSTGEERLMRCMMGVTEHLKGGTLGYDPTSHNLITVFDIDKQAYRSINTEGIVYAIIRGVKYINKEQGALK